MAIAFALALTRTAMFVVTSPFPGPAAPTQVRIGLALALAIACTPSAASGPMPAFGLPLVVAALGEAMAGGAIGFVFRVGLSAADVLGSTLAHSMGLTFASSYDATQGTNSDSLTRIVTTLASLVMFATGAHRVVIGAVLSSQRIIPVGGMMDLGTFVPGMLSWVDSSIECGLGLALPAMAVSLVVQVALGLVARAAPSLQVFSVGLSLTLGSGLIVLLSGLRDDIGGLASHFGSLLRVLESVLAAAR